MSAHAFRIHAVVCSNALPYFQDLVRNARELASRDAKIAVVAHCTDADLPLAAPFYAAIESASSAAKRASLQGSRSSMRSELGCRTSPPATPCA